MKTAEQVEIKKLNEIIYLQKIEIENMAAACRIARNDLVSAIDEIVLQREVIEDLNSKLFAKNNHVKTG
jgi:hypothetical protein